VPGGTQNLGSPGSQWQNLYVSGTANVGSLSIGGGATITKHLSAATTWAPASISNNTSTSTTVTVTGAHIGDTVTVGFSQAVPADALLVGSVTATNTVTVTLFNNTGSPLVLTSGTLRADVWQH
jgi:carbonic anhydrase/acetyltransferase-like protein (isoleucine patch superfamily)